MKALISQAALLVAVWSLPAASPALIPARTDLSDAFFSNGVVPSLSLQLDASALGALRLHPRAYVKATVSEGPVLYPNVGVHLKGQYGTFQNFEGKPSLTLNFNKFVRGQKFHGLDKVHLNNSVSDPSYLTELLCRELFLAAGLPAGRASHARATLNGREAGLYVLVEGHDKSFLRRHFPQTHGNLYDSEFMHDITEPLRKASGDGPDDHSDLQALALACEEPDPDVRLAKLGSMVDLDRFYSFLAVELMTCHADGYARAKNNYWVYHDPTLSRFVFLPYGMDQMFWQPEGSSIPQLKGVLAEAVLQSSPGLTRIRERCAVLFTNHFPRLTNRVEELRARLRPVLAQLGTNALAQHDRAVAQLQQRIGARQAHLRKQLLAPAPSSIRMSPGGQTALGPWLSSVERGKAELVEIPGPGGTRRLQTRLGPGGESAVATWQARVLLPQGRYQVFASVAADSAVFRGPNRPVALKVWGGLLLQAESMTRDPRHLGLLHIVEARSDRPEEMLVQGVCRGVGAPVTFVFEGVTLTRLE